MLQGVYTVCKGDFEMSAVRAETIVEPYVSEDRARGLFRVNRRVFVEVLLDGGAVSAASRSGKKQIRPAESAAPQRLLIHRQFPGRRLPVIGKYPAGIPLERCERN
jgi:hypothetical protein